MVSEQRLGRVVWVRDVEDEQLTALNLLAAKAADVAACALTFTNGAEQLLEHA